MCNVNYGINDTGCTKKKKKKIDKHNQKLISILENQKIYGGFLKNTDILGFTFQNPFTKVLLCKWVIESETQNISTLKKPP